MYNWMQKQLNKHRAKREKGEAGFTLIELIVVIAIMGILAGGGYAGYSGYVNRAALVQQAPVLDVRCMRVSPACRELAERESGLAGCFAQDGTILWKKLPENTEYVDISLKLSRAIRAAGYGLLWDPRQYTKL